MQTLPRNIIDKFQGQKPQQKLSDNSQQIFLEIPSTITTTFPKKVISRREIHGKVPLLKGL